MFIDDNEVLANLWENGENVKQRLQNRYGLSMSKELKKEMAEMCNLGSAVLQQGYDEGHAEGFVEGECTTVYAIVQDGDISPEKGAKRLNITVDELRSRMTLTGYKWPEQK